MFPGNVIFKADEEIGHHEDKQYSGGWQKKSDWYHPYNILDRKALEIWSTSMETTQPAWSEQTKLRQGLQLCTETSQ